MVKSDDVPIIFRFEIDHTNVNSIMRYPHLNFIENQDCTNFIASLTQRSQKLLRSFIYTTLSLNGFNNNSTSLIVHQSLQGGNIIQLTNLNTGYHGCKRLLILRLR